MSVEQNKEFIRRYFDEVWNKGNLDKEAEFIGKDAVVHAPPIPGLPPGIAGPLAVVGMFRAAMPDLHVSHDVLFGEGDKMAHHWVARGTHRGAPLFGAPPSGKELQLNGINVFRIVGGKIVERWGSIDTLGVAQQMGLAPDPRRSGPGSR
ncbi:ester cyclase [Corallococcus macrosporus]|uniref:Ester cyclase n=1 Tax=Corallococcus macrosporus TaxID=35 RepID=A0ABS3DJN9_9BACT|nr:ester cyclase [Corallococcus macrosporus]MBN8231535.1 ester cyclase [Corallococcus macrosporus]